MKGQAPPAHVVVDVRCRPSNWPRAARVAAALGAALPLVTTTPAQAADPAKGATLYANHCASCHGKSGKPVWPGAPDLSRQGTLLRTDAQLITLLKQGRGVMPSYLGVIRDREMLDLLAYLRTLS